MITAEQLKERGREAPEADAEIFHDDALLHPADLCGRPLRGSGRLPGRLLLEAACSPSIRPERRWCL